MRQSKFAKFQSGLSLIELMISLTIGLVVIGTVFSTMLTNQKALLSKEVLDRTQEELRFSTNTITRLVRQATSFEVPGNEHELIVKFNPEQRDCLGNTGFATVNTLKLVGKQLICVTKNEEGQTQDYVLAKNIQHLVFQYGILTSNNLSFQDYTTLPTVIAAVKSIKTEIAVKEPGAQSESYIEFIATSHIKSVIQ